MSSQKTNRRFAFLLSAAAFFVVVMPASAQADRQYAYPMDPPAQTYQQTYQYQPAPLNSQPVQQYRQANDRYQPAAPDLANVRYQPPQQVAQQYQSNPRYQPPQQIQLAVAPPNADIQSLPSYNYAPQPATLPQPAYHPALAQSPYWGLETRRGFDIGIQGFYYRYREPGVDVTNVGGMGGITAKGTATFGHGYFASADGRFAAGGIDYRGSGTAPNKFTDLWEVRGLVGRDFMIGQYYSLSPYFGIGYRDLYDDGQGLSTTGDFGYRRENQLLYFPIGIQPRTHIDSNTRLTSSLEFDAVIHGQQTSYLSDGGFGDPDFRNQQTSGFGVRGDIMYERRDWSIGPFFNFWRIDESKVKTVGDGNGATCALFSASAPCAASFIEPRNFTLEAGVQLKYHFPNN